MPAEHHDIGDRRALFARARAAHRVPAVIALVWLGILIGVSFMATPIKFSASDLDLPTALQVGRVTFHLLAGTEWVLAVALFASAWLTRQRLPWSAFAIVAIIALESWWLLPALGARTDIIRAGGTVPASNLHTLFIVGEVAECFLLAHLAWATAARPHRRRKTGT